MEIQGSDWVKIIVAVISAVALIVANGKLKLPRLPKFRQLVIGILAIIFLGSLIWLIYPIVIGTTIHITDPIDGAYVERCEVVRGNANRLPTGSTVWVLIQPSTTPDRVYPQNETTVSHNDSWSGQVCMGQEEEVGLGFSIIVVLADSHAQQELKNYKEISDDTGEFPGILGLPNGAEEYDRIIVTRK